MKKHIGNLLGGLALVAGLVTSNAAQAGFSTTEVQLHYGDGYRMGSNANFATNFDEDTQRATITLEHFSTNDIGEIYYHLHSSNFGLTFDEGSLINGLDMGIGLNQGTDVSIGLAGPRLGLNIPGFNFFTLAVYAYNNFDDPFN